MSKTSSPRYLSPPRPVHHLTKRADALTVGDKLVRRDYLRPIIRIEQTGLGVVVVHVDAGFGKVVRETFGVNEFVDTVY